jgi:capsular polysaccharide transport system permease protein
LQTAEANDPRVRTAERRISVIRERIVQERRSFAELDVTVDETDYPRLETLEKAVEYLAGKLG